MIDIKSEGNDSVHNGIGCDSKLTLSDTLEVNISAIKDEKLPISSMRKKLKEEGKKRTRGEIL